MEMILDNEGIQMYDCLQERRGKEVEEMEDRGRRKLIH